ncbi:MAG: ATP-binding cassette domain-containing protein [Spongiibacteraceae bacterium]|jgi:peptide/nickel transport system ATP-binding protein|nr:ATP-binding cassette domain-containing protein [Spongiibacteraceae bacterium]
MSDRTEPLLQVRKLRKYFVQRSGVFRQHKRYVHAVDDVSFDIPRGETLGLVGESGCGKSTLGRTLLRLYQPDAGSIHFQGQELTALSGGEMRRMRRHLQMVFQDPYDSLNPRHSVGNIIEEPLLVHGMGDRRERQARVRALIDQVGLPADSVDRYPHEFSGGQRQRIGIARAIACNPAFIVCDEAVSALDVSIQAQIVNLLLDLRQSMELTLLFISHDLSVVRHLSDRVAVMYLGQIVEIAPAATIYENARHPYTRYLIAAIPQPRVDSTPPPAVGGDIPSPLAPPSGCRFHTRCPMATERCAHEAPLLELITTDGGEHRAACHYWRETPGRLP